MRRENTIGWPKPTLAVGVERSQGLSSKLGKSIPVSAALHKAVRSLQSEHDLAVASACLTTQVKRAETAVEQSDHHREEDKDAPAGDASLFLHLALQMLCIDGPSRERVDDVARQTLAAMGYVVKPPGVDLVVFELLPVLHTPEGLHSVDAAQLREMLVEA